MKIDININNNAGATKFDRVRLDFNLYTGIFIYSFMEYRFCWHNIIWGIFVNVDIETLSYSKKESIIFR